MSTMYMYRDEAQRGEGSNGGGDAPARYGIPKAAEADDTADAATATATPAQ